MEREGNWKVTWAKFKENNEDKIKELDEDMIGELWEEQDWNTFTEENKDNMRFDYVVRHIQGLGREKNKDKYSDYLKGVFPEVEDEKYTIYSVLSNKTHKSVNINKAREIILSEIKLFKDESDMEKKLGDLIRKNIKPKAGMADIKKDLLYRITPSEQTIQTGTLTLRYGIDSKLEKALDNINDFTEYLRSGIIKELSSTSVLPDKVQRDWQKQLDIITKIVVNINEFENTLTEIFENTPNYKFSRAKDSKKLLYNNEFLEGDARNYVRSFISNSGKGQGHKISFKVKSLHRYFKDLDKTITELEHKYKQNIQSYVNVGSNIDLDTDHPLPLIALEYIKAIKNLGLPTEDYYTEKITVDYSNWLEGIKGLEMSEEQGGEASVNATRAFEIYFTEVKEPYMIWFKDEYNGVLESKYLQELLKYMQSDELQVKELLSSDKLMSEPKAKREEKSSKLKEELKTIKGLYIKEKNKEQFSEFKGSDAYNWFINDLTKTEDFPNWYENGLRQYYLDLINNHTKPEEKLLIYSSTDFDTTDMNLFIKTIKEAYEFSKLSDKDKKDKYSDYGKPYALLPDDDELKKENTSHLENYTGKAVGDGDEELFWLFLWMDKHHRDTMIDAFDTFSQTEFKDNELNLPLANLLELDDKALDIQKISDTYRNIYLAKIYDKQNKNLPILESLEKQKFIKIATEKPPKWKALNTYDMKPKSYGNQSKKGHNQSSRVHSVKYPYDPKNKKTKDDDKNNTIMLNISNKYKKLMGFSKKLGE